MNHSHSLRHVEIKVTAGRNHKILYTEADAGLSSIRNMVENPPYKAEDLYPHTTSSLKASSGAAEGVLDLGVLRCLAQE